MKDEQFIERRIITGLIVSTEYLNRIRKIWDPKLLSSSAAKLIAGWCIEFYDKYHKAPGRGETESIFLKKSKRLSAENNKDIENILVSLSDEYEQQDEFNIDSLVDETVDYFRQEHANGSIKQVQLALETGDVDEAEQLIKDFKPLGISSSNISKFILNLNQMKKLKIEKPRLLISPWLREGQVTFIYGQYGTGKSLLAIHIAQLLALKIEHSRDWDVGEWQVKNPTGCLYVDGEMGVMEVRDRLESFKGLGVQQHPMKVFALPEYQLATEDDFVLSERKNQLQIINWLKDHPDYKLLILDSVTTLFGLTDENSNAEWNTKINPLLRDLKASGIATIILHHAGKDEKKGLRGASAMGAMAHNIFALINHQSKDIDEGEAWFTLIKKKQRSAGFQFKSFDLHYYKDSAMRTEWETGKGMKSNGEELNDKEIMIIKKLIKAQSSQKDIAKLMGCTQGFVAQTKNKAKKLGYLNNDNRGTKKWEELYDRHINRAEDD